MHYNMQNTERALKRDEPVKIHKYERVPAFTRLIFVSSYSPWSEWVNTFLFSSIYLLHKLHFHYEKLEQTLT